MLLLSLLQVAAASLGARPVSSSSSSRLVPAVLGPLRLAQQQQQVLLTAWQMTPWQQMVGPPVVPSEEVARSRWCLAGLHNNSSRWCLAVQQLLVVKVVVCLALLLLLLLLVAVSLGAPQQEAVVCLAHQALLVLVLLHLEAQSLAEQQQQEVVVVEVVVAG